VKGSARSAFVVGAAAAVLVLATALHRGRVTTQARPYTTPLATGVRLDPIGDAIDLGSMPLAMAVAPDGNRVAVVLAGWREQGLQIIDLRSRRVVQTLGQPAAFAGIAFSRDGRALYVSGGWDDSIFCYSWEKGSAALQRKVSLADGDAKPGSRYPAGIAVSADGRYLYVAENVGDSLAVIDLTTSRVVSRFETGHYPYGVELATNGMVYVSAWGANTIAVFQAQPDGRLAPSGELTVGARPSSLISTASGARLFVALATSDRIAVVDTGQRKVLGYFADAAPGGPSEGSTPNALALSPDGSRLFVAEADNNAVAVFNASGQPSAGEPERWQPEGRIPSDWYPTALLDVGGRLLILSGKGHGSRPNPDGPTPGHGINRPFGYALGQLNGTLRICPDRWRAPELSKLSQRVAEANGWNDKRSARKYPPFNHVLYIIKENRTYDQVLGDLQEGDGDANLVFFGPSVSPNHHALALRFGVFDRFFTNAEVSSQGHIWSTAAYVTDYGEKLIPSVYSERRSDVDGDEIDEPLNGFLWHLARKKGISFRDYGEMIKTEGWPVTQRDLAPDISPTYPPFNLRIPDQRRADAWIAELQKFAQDGHMPSLEIMHLPGDHTAGARAGYPTPQAYMADNDLALGRIVEALSKSPFWRDTVVFVVEDDAQAGPDHVDSHRAPFYAISAYSRPGTIHRFVNTTDVVAAIEDILGLDRLSKYDYFSRSLADLFADSADLSPWSALVPRASMTETNPANTLAAAMSEAYDFTAPDRGDDQMLNRILWLAVKGNVPPPITEARAPLHLYHAGR